MRRSLRPSRRSRALAAAALAAALAGCAETASRADPEERADSVTAETAPVAPARYLTHLMFAGVDGRAFFASFSQETDQRRLSRVYEAWFGTAAGWTELVRVRDTLPVPRAAWRILPAGDMSVRVGDDRQILSLGFDGPAGPLRLRAGTEVSVWTGPTGQRESVGLAALTRGDSTVGGVLFFRRAARNLRFPGEAAEPRGFVLADSSGNGLLIQTDETVDRTVARTWLHGTVAAWDGVTLAADTTSAASTRRWTFEIPEAALRGTIRTIATPATGPVPAFRVECDLTADGQVYRFVGVAAPLPLP